jgi:hypothetical protein
MKTFMNRLTSVVLLLRLLVFVAHADKNANSASLLHGTPDAVHNPFACSLSAADEDSCTSAQDDDGNPCVWCKFAQAGGACVSSEQASEISRVVPQVLMCDSPSSDNALIQDAMDPSCLVVGYKGGNEDACHSADDENGNACVWCNGPNDVGICLNSNQAAMAGHWLTCDDDDATAAVALEEKEMQSPLDPTCIEAGLQGDKDSCEATQDQDGNTCVWCEGGDASTGLCLNSEQASMAS